jgi:hypothetical protein
VAPRDRIRVEFFGGEIVCTGCGAVLHINHSRWWFGVTVLGCEGWLLVVFAVTLLAVNIGWWILPVAAGAFVAAGVVVALTSPLKVVDRSP